MRVQRAEELGIYSLVGCTGIRVVSESFKDPHSGDERVLLRGQILAPKPDHRFILLPCIV